jgi:O-antigen/teichoic acid export membrane protein
LTSAATAESAIEAPARPVRPAAVSRWKSARHWGLALFDQAVVSGSRFLITIIVGRFAGPEDLGRYASAFYTLVLLGCIQEALLTTPFAICAPRLRPRSRAALTGGVVVMHALLLGTVVLAGLLVVGFMNLFATSGEVFLMTMAIVVAAPLSLMWEFARRMMLARLSVGHATLIDVLAAMLQVAGLVVLAATDQLTGTRAVAVVGIGCALPAVIYSWRLLPSTWPRHLPLYWGRTWQIGKWIMGTQIVRAMSGTIPIWLLASLVGDPAAGLFAACVSIPMIANPFVFAVSNLLMPKAAHAYGEQGVRGLVRLLVAALGLTAVALLPLTIVLLLAGGWILTAIYGPAYSGQGLTLAVLAVCPILWMATSALACGQTALKHTRAGFMATLCGVIVSTVTIAALAPTLQVLAGAIGLLSGAATMCLIQVWQLSRRCRELA